MKATDLTVDMTFVTSELPLERAVTCGIKCIGIEAQKVSFKRMGKIQEEFSLFIDAKTGEVNMGNWIKFPDLEEAMEYIDAMNSCREWDMQNIASATKNLETVNSQIKTTLTSMMKGEYFRNE